MHHLPLPGGRPIGRDAVIQGILRVVMQRRMATIVGPGGIGKTTVAMAVAAAAGQHGLDTCFVDLGPVQDERFVPGAVATALGLAQHASDAVPALLACLRDRRLLIVLDSCEHVLDTAAVLAERIVAGAPGVLVLSTSREALRAGGEVVQRLAPLEFPPGAGPLTAAAAMEYPAVRLFAERAAECVEDYRVTDTDAPAVAEICRRLEGIALAIELAATRIDAFGARELAARLDDRLQLLERGRRGAQSRHRTLAAALDWSYAFLPAIEQTVLRTVAAFASAFTLDAAAALCAATGTAATIVDAVADLVAKSLLSADASAAVMRYRLLDTTRAYALQKLDECGETAAVRRRHAELFRAISERAAVEWEARPTEDWLADHGRGIDDVRSALAWATSAAGDGRIGIALTVAAIPLWTHLSLLDECRRCVEQALAARPAPHEAMKLHAARAAAIQYARGPLGGAGASWLRALTLARRLDDSEYQLRALWGLAVHRSYVGKYRQALVLAERFRTVAASKGDRAALVSVDRLIATALHYLGDQPAARRHLDAMLGRYAAPVQRSHIGRFQLDQRAAALGTLANVLWLQGYPDQAVDAVHAALHGARESGHALSLLNAYAHAACPVFMYVGDDAAAEGVLDELYDHLARHGLTMWTSLWRCLRGVLLVRRGQPDGLGMLEEALDELRQAGFRLRYPAYLGTLAAALGGQGHQAEAIATIDEALDCCEVSEERWCLPELLRVKGELLERADPHAAELLYQQALDVARAQDALAWQLRLATSLARLWRRHGREQQGRRLLASVYVQFAEGRDTADLRRARTALAEEKPEDAVPQP